MSQGSLTIADGDGLSVLAAINALGQRLATMASGTSRPSDIAAGEFWRQTNNPGGGVHSIWLYDGASDILFATLNTVSHAIALASGVLDALLGSTRGMLAKRGASAWAGFAKGNAFEMLGVDSSGTDLEWKRPGFERIAADAVPSNAANVTFSSIPSNVKHLIIPFHLRPATNAVNLLLQLSIGGSVISAANYFYGTRGDATNSGTISIGNTGQTSLPLSLGSYPISNSGTVGGISGVVEIANVQDGKYPRVRWRTDWGPETASSLYWEFHGAGGYAGAGPVDGFRFLFSSGNVQDGIVSAFGARA